MAGVAQNVQKLIRNLKDGGKVSLQCGALTYIRSNAEKLQETSALKEEEYGEICKLVVELIGSADENTRNEASKALRSILKHFDSHGLKFFEAALHVNRKKRLKIFQFLETADDEMIVAAAQDPMTVNFMNDGLHTVQTNTMEWLLPSACADNLLMLVQAENRLLSDDQELDELTINYVLNLLQRLYKIASVSADFNSTQRFDTLLMDKVVTLAYMGHKRQRAPAIKLLHEAIGTNLGMHIKTKYSDVWARYKNDLQGPYCTRMALLVKACEMDWTSQWSISIQLLGTDLHRGATLINNLLSVEERAFKSTDPNVRRQAFVSWKMLVDNFALDPKELATARRIKLLCVPLTAKNSKSELIALTKLEVWWYLIAKLYPCITKFADPVITQFLNFCFGPLGDTPLLSAKAEVIASPGKRFYKTKIVAIDALLQLIVPNQEERKTLAPILQQRLTNSITEELFRECYKAILHSVGEAVVIIGQLHENEMRNREEIIKVLLTNLMRYTRSTSAELKGAVYNEFILIVTELLNRAPEMSSVTDFVRDVFVTELASVAADLTFRDRILIDLMYKIINPTILNSVRKKHCEAIKCLLWQALKPKGHTQFHSETLQFLGTTLQELENLPTGETGFADCFELWFACTEIAYDFSMSQNINEGTDDEPSFKTIESIVRFPFAHMYSMNSIQAQRIAVNWKDLYKQYEHKADVVFAMKPNEIFDKTSKMIQDCLNKNNKCYRIAVYCLDALLSTINYEKLHEPNEIPTIVRLVADLTTIALHEGQAVEADCALKALSALLITVYGHSPEKALAYLLETSQTIQLMLKTDAEDVLIKEVSSTWETIVSILRGLNALLDLHFLTTYKLTILSAIRHSNPEIVAQAESVIAMKDSIKEPARAVLMELEQEARKSALKIKSDKADRALKQMRMAGSFMNRKASPSPRLTKQKDREEKKLAPLPPEPESQDYVVIETDVKLDVNRLTEHQKESFKRRRDDIPAMYNDLSQSSSQDTQDLQQWFDGKAKHTTAPTAAASEKESVAVANVDHNEEKKIEKIVSARDEKIIEESIVATNVESKNSDEKTASENATPVSLVADDQKSSEIADVAEPAKESEKPLERERKKLQQTTVNLSPIICPLADHSYVGTSNTGDKESSNKDETGEIVAKKLDFESRDEYPETKDKELEKPASSTDAAPTNGKTRALRSAKVAEAKPASEARNAGGARIMLRGRTAGRSRKNSTSESQDSSSGGKTTRAMGKVRVIPTRKLPTNADSAERGIKRKAASDSESDGSERSKRLRRKTSRSPSNTSSDAESVTPAGHIDKRTESEMSRLRIDMVFDGPLPSRRRSKANDESAVSENLGKRQHSPEPKAMRAKIAEPRTSDNNVRRSLRGSEKEGVSLPKKIRRSRNKSLDGKFIPSGKKILSEGGNSVSQTIVDDETPDDDTVGLKNEAEKTEVKAGEDAVNVAAAETEAIISENVADAVAEEPMTNDDDEVVESSQEDPSVAGTNRKTIISALTLAKVNNADAEPAIGETLPRASSPIIPTEELMETESSGKDTLADHKTPHDDSDETFLDISAIKSQPVEDVVPDDSEKKVPEENKTNGTSAPSRIEPSFNFSSPKNPSKRFAKPKSFAVHGRAAHMLGLVTKLAVMEKDTEADKTTDEDPTTAKKSKTRENDNDYPAKKERTTIFKDSERMGSPGGSRQEKIFNNMKSADYAASPPGKLFGNLRNNGEKVSPNMSKIHAEAATSMDSDLSSAREDDEDVSQTSERDELPMLEWSSANPPSLTASPSASILKRIRQIPTDAEMETTPNKSLRKRVSFADPPVSKEMGYEIASGGSPLKTSKFTSRSLFDRKNSPLRFKQSRFKMIQVEAEKADKDEEPRPLGASELDMDCERENALLVKIAEDLEDTAEFRTVDIRAEANGPTRLEMNSREEIEMIEGDKSKSDKIVAEDANHLGKLSSNPGNTTLDDVETQDDLFNSSDEKDASPKRFADGTGEVSREDLSVSTQNSIGDSIKLNVTDDSVIGSITNLAIEHDNSECLEDTVDVRNVPSLNSTANSDEMFCEKPTRTSTQAAPDGLSQMDTLPVTDSIFASLPTQDSQESTQANMGLAMPQLMNDTDAIYPTLVDCSKPIDSILSSLTNPLWIKNLSNHLAMRGIATVGDLARLTEREIVRIPVKGSPKVDFVRKVLRRFEEKLPVGPAKAPSPKSHDKEADYLALVSDKDITMSISENMDVSELPTLDVSAVTLPSQEAPNYSVSAEDSAPRVQQSIRRTSTTMSSVGAEPSICTVLEDTPTMSQISTINLTSDTLPGTMVSIGTSTDSLPKPPSKSVGAQMQLEDLLDEVDAKLVLQSAVRRCSAETLLAQYKLKMGHMSDTELGKETMRMLELDTKTAHSEATLKAACRACGLNKVLSRLPAIFNGDGQFYAKVLSAYRKNIKVTDCLQALDIEEVKNEICKKCSSSELAEMLSRALKKENANQDAKSPDVSSLKEMLKKMPLDVIVSHTVANNELIPSSVVLDVALRNNDADFVTHEIESQYPEIAQKIVDGRMTAEFIASRVKSTAMSRDEILNVHGAACAKLSPEDLLDAYHEAMRRKLNAHSG